MSVESESCENIVCFICEQDCESNESEPSTIVTRGLQTLKNVSLERKDGKIKALSNIQSIKVHVKCRQNYTMRKDGKLKFDYSPANYNAWKFSPARKKLRFSDTFCDLKKNVLFAIVLIPQASCVL